MIDQHNDFDDTIFKVNKTPKHIPKTRNDDHFNLKV